MAQGELHSLTVGHYTAGADKKQELFLMQGGEERNQRHIQGAAVYRRPPLLAALAARIFFLIKWKSSPPKAASGLSGFTRTTGERVVLFLPKQKQKAFPHPFPLSLKGTSQNSGRLFAGLTHSL